MNPFIVEAPSIGDQYLRGVQIGQEQGAQKLQMAQQLQQMEAQKAQNEAYQQDMWSLSQKGTITGRDIAMLQAKYPQMAGQVKEMWSTLKPEQQSTLLQEAGEYQSALANGRPDVAASLMMRKAEAAKNSGDEEGYAKYTHMAELAQKTPDVALSSVAHTLAAINGPEAYEKTYGTITNAYLAQQEHPYKVAELSGKAATAQAEGAGAEERVALENTGKAEDIKSKILQRKLDVAKGQLDLAKNDTERMKVQAEIDKLQAEMGQKQQEQTQGQQGIMDTAQNTIDTVDKLLVHPGFKSATGMGGDFMSWFNGTDAKDFRNQLQTLGSQQFLAGVAKLKAAGGAGALSDAEGKKLEAAISNLSPEQGPDQLRENMLTIKTLMGKMQQAALANPNLPTQGGAFVMKSPKYGEIREGDINRLMKEHPGTTRQDVIEYLQQAR